MQGRTKILMLAALLCVPALGSGGEAGQSARERQAQPRSSSSSDRQAGSGQSSAAQRHAQPRSSGASRSSGGSASRHQAPSVRRDSPPVLTGAQARHPRPGTGTGYRYGRGYQPRGYYPWYARQYYSRYPWFGLGYGGAYYGSYGYYPYYAGGYGYGYGYGYDPAPSAVYMGYRDPDAGWVRVQVQPGKTKVHVDGHFAGVTDDFDGMLQGLTLEPGRHELTLELDGYRTHRVLVYVSAGVTLKIRHDMERGAGAPSLEDLTEGRGEDEVPVAAAAPPERDRDSRYRRHEPVAGRAPGVLRLNVSPADAAVYVDGALMGSAEAAAELALAPGAHRIEVVRPGYDPWVREVELEAGERRELVVELPPR